MKIQGLISFACLLIVGLSMSACKMIQFEPIDERFPIEAPLFLNEDISVESTGPVLLNMMNVKKADFMAPGVKILYRDLVIYIDPLEVKNPSPADYIFITHAHADHFSMVDIKNLAGEETIIVGPSSIKRKLKDFSLNEARLGELVQLADITYEVVPSYNMKRGFFQMTIHKKTDDFCGYIISIDSIRIYHAGDTDLIPEMKDFDELTLALVPIGTGKTAMTPQKAAEAVNLMQPEITIPIHYELDRDKNPNLFSWWINRSG